MTIKFNSSYIKDYYSLLGKNEHSITVKGDLLIDDYYYEKRSVEEAESEYVKKCVQGLLNKSKLKEKDINLFIVFYSIYNFFDINISHNLQGSKLNIKIK